MKRSLYLYIYILVASLQGASAAGTDTTAIGDRVLQTQTGIYGFFDRIWLNPSMKYYRQGFSLTTLCAEGIYERKGEASLVQEGSEYKGWDVNVASYLKLGAKDKAFGTASYSNGQTDNVRWNENSDWAIIYPYVIGDSIGGQMNSETYRFSGGYAHEWKEWTFGTQIAYRASLSYRDKDPRPRNVVSDLDFTLSAAYQTKRRYLLGMALKVRKYNQNNDIDFLADAGENPVYQMLGLGVDYVRFAGTQTSSNYKGNGIGGSLDLLPLSRKGIAVSLAFDYFGFTKELPLLNNAPINRVKDFQAKSEIAWTHITSGGWRYGARLNADMTMRKGIENIFGDPAGNVYPLISSATQYNNTSTQAILSELIERQMSIGHLFCWNLMPSVGYGWMKPKHTGSNRFIEVSALHIRLQAHSLWKWKKASLMAGLKGGYISNIEVKHSLSGLNAETSRGAAIWSNLRYLGDSYASAAVSLRADYIVTPRYVVFLSGQWTHQAYHTCGSTDYGELSVGVIF